MNTPDDLVLELTFVLDAPRHEVFDAWTQPAQLRRWLAPQEFPPHGADIRPRPGAPRHAPCRAPAGTEHSELGIVRECTPPAHLALTQAWLADNGKPGHETLFTVDLIDENG